MLPNAEIVPASRPNRWRWLRLALLALGVLFLLAWAARTMGLTALAEQVIAELRTMGAPVFFSAMAILPAFGFPLLPFALAAGPVYSPLLGVGGVIACAILAVAINVALSYLFAAIIFRPPAQWLVRRFGYNLPDPSRQNAWLITLLVRVAPGPPFWVQSYALGLVRVRFAAYLLVSTLVPSGYLTAAIVFGDALMYGRPRAALLALGLIGLFGLGLYLLRRKMRSPTTPAVSAGK